MSGNPRTAAVRRQRVLTFVRQYASTRGYAPSVREIAQAVHASQSSVHYHLSQLEAEGLVRRERGLSRALVIA